MSAPDQATDAEHMARCLELAEKFRGRTAPNPIVGCVIVDRRGTVIAEGAHRGPGKRHGEADALARATRSVAGATLYCNLEPCNHTGRTPPCTGAIIEAGIARVVFGAADPIAGHGGGARVLRRAGIAVTRGVLGDACLAANRPFFTWATQHRPAFTLKAAITLDGKIATVTGESKWITGDAARADVMRLRDTHDAVVVGIGTVLADDPRLSARRRGGRDPVRVVVDGALRTPLDAAVLTDSPRTIIATRADAPADREVALAARGVEIWRFPGTDRVDLAALALRLGAAGITSALVEGGGELHAGMLAAGLADELVVYVAPIVVGGAAKSWVGGDGVAALADAWGFALEGTPTVLGRDTRLRFVRGGS